MTKGLSLCHHEEIGCTIIGLTGFSGGILAQQADIQLHAADHSYGPVEDVHLICNHYLVESLKQPSDGLLDPVFLCALCVPSRPFQNHQAL